MLVDGEKISQTCHIPTSIHAISVLLLTFEQLCNNLNYALRCLYFISILQGSEHGPPAWRMLNVHDGLYFVHFQPSLSTLQSFAIAVAIIHAQSPALRPKCTGILSTKVQGLKIM